MRASQLQLNKGYIPEAEILLRVLLEDQMLLAYILDDVTDSRVEKYLSFDETQRWDTRLLMNEFLGGDSYEMYKNISQYVHPHNLGRSKMLYNNSLQSSSIHNYEAAGAMLVMVSNAAVGQCEQISVLFKDDPEWNKKHQEIEATDIFKKNLDEAMEKFSNGDEAMEKLLSHLEKTHNKNKK